MFLTFLTASSSFLFEFTPKRKEEARTLSRARSTGSKRKTDSGHCARDQAFLTFGRPFIFYFKVKMSAQRLDGEVLGILRRLFGPTMERERLRPRTPLRIETSPSDTVLLTVAHIRWRRTVRTVSISSLFPHGH